MLSGLRPVGGPSMVSAAASWRARAVPLAVLLASAMTLAVAAWLQPDGRGMGTHQQLGLLPCDVLTSTGLPCPTCGMTTAFALAVRGHLLAAAWSQPAGALLAMLTAAATLVSACALLTGMSLNPILKFVWRPSAVWTFAAVALVAWLFKIYTVCGTLG